MQPGDLVLIRPGARVPVDGIVRDGSSAVDESVVTGESMPQMRTTGDPVVAGSVNTSGRLIVEATVDGADTTVARIAEMVQNAQSSRARIQRLADRVCSVFVPAVLTIATLTVIANKKPDQTAWDFVQEVALTAKTTTVDVVPGAVSGETHLSRRWRFRSILG